MKKIKGKKIIYIIVLVIIVGALFTVYNAFNGNPISKAIAKKKYVEYIEKTYPNTDFKVDKVYYNFKNGRYDGNVVSKEKGLEFYVSIYDDYTYDQYRDDKVLLDYDLTRRFSEKIEDDFSKELEKNGMILEKDSKESDWIFVQIDVLQGKYRDEKTEFLSEFDDPFVVDLKLGKALNDNYEDELVKAGKILRDIALKNNYKGILGVVVSGYSNDKSYCFVLNKEDFNIKDEELKNHVYEGYSNYKGLLAGDTKIEIEKDIKKE